MAAQLKSDGDFAAELRTWLGFWVRWGTVGWVVGIALGMLIVGWNLAAIAFLGGVFAWSVLATTRRMPYVRFGTRLIEIWDPLNTGHGAPQLPLLKVACESLDGVIPPPPLRDQYSEACGVLAAYTERYAESLVVLTRSEVESEGRLESFNEQWEEVTNCWQDLYDSYYAAF